jgi:carbonic anhydrase
MPRKNMLSRRRSRQVQRHRTLPDCEGLETRVVLNAPDPLTHANHHAVPVSPRSEAVLVAQQSRTPVIGTLSGQVTNDSHGRGFGHIRVELLNSSGNIVQTVFTTPSGKYTFKIRQNGAYVVREVTPKNFVQTSPTFTNVEATGSFNDGYGNNSWNYKTGNSDPTLGPVGPANWSTIAPAGSLPFESPINITGAPIDLSKVLTINYPNAVPTQIINNSHQIQVQFPETSTDLITLGGTQFNFSQFHYHDPAENLVNGYANTMEEHFVNVSATGAEAVVGVFLQLGAHNSALDTVLNAAMASLTKPNSKTTITDPINFAGLLPSSLEGWYYPGSLTTPPLSQTVNWLVLATPITLDFQQLMEYEAVADGSGFLPNARPVQPMDGRQLNEVDFNVNFQNTSMSGLNFSVALASRVTTQTSLGSSNILPNSSSINTSSVRALGLPLVASSRVQVL